MIHICIYIYIYIHLAGGLLRREPGRPGDRAAASRRGARARPGIKHSIDDNNNNNNNDNDNCYYY